MRKSGFHVSALKHSGILTGSESRRSRATQATSRVRENPEQKFLLLVAARRRAFRLTTLAKKHRSILKHFAYRAPGRAAPASPEPLLRLDFAQGGLLFA
ncbi:MULTISPECIES: hypothetical protein [Burkholderia]|uniref:hypothetical protein n=1 Tax=Burkholderia TaxID=32008 RepID=UPI0011777BBD|nr:MULTISPECIES: hypothetical protein [Burkholderia]EKS9793885.1 hypothetical protein [Burkholderia cepacia]EKS9803416.1 hypothetical protein [Burkholderia cepacia]EKS9811230.1 hypothetical protein [Burkholderia cepacia]EKS9819367.1 hypothetical protein [Burkholderia cepacia]EKS9825980.1 hypothetical protein [Burkholderia cepacia]